MKKLAYIVIALILLIGAIVFQQKRIDTLKKETKIHKQNEKTLLGTIERYRTKDSLNVVSLSNLQLSLDTYKKYRKEDYELIQRLKIDKKSLQSITTAQVQTTTELQFTVIDTIVYVDSVQIDTLRCVDYTDDWLTVNGCISNATNEFKGVVENRDSLLYIEHIIQRRFLFFRFGVKEKRQEIVSKNPNTMIMNAEFISVRER